MSDNISWLYLRALSLPETRIVSFPWAARTVPPDTGLSTRRTSALCTCSKVDCKVFKYAAGTVEHSKMVALGASTVVCQNRSLSSMIHLAYPVPPHYLDRTKLILPVAHLQPCKLESHFLGQLVEQRGCPSSHFPELCEAGFINVITCNTVAQFQEVRSHSKPHRSQASKGNIERRSHSRLLFCFDLERFWDVHRRTTI